MMALNSQYMIMYLRKAPYMNTGEDGREGRINTYFFVLSTDPVLCNAQREFVALNIYVHRDDSVVDGLCRHALCMYGNLLATGCLDSTGRVILVLTPS